MSHLPIYYELSKFSLRTRRNRRSLCSRRYWEINAHLDVSDQHCSCDRGICNSRHLTLNESINLQWRIVSLVSNPHQILVEILIPTSTTWNSKIGPTLACTWITLHPPYETECSHSSPRLDESQSWLNLLSYRKGGVNKAFWQISIQVPLLPRPYCTEGWNHLRAWADANPTRYDLFGK